jgi:phosphoribosylanthranilate isomerase
VIKIKICGITNIEDALAAIDCGADALGFVFYPKSPRAVSPGTAKSIIKKLPPIVTNVGVFVDQDRDEIRKITSDTGLNIIQLHGSEPPEACNLGLKVVKAIRVKELSDLDMLQKYNNVSSFLLDAYTPDFLGGTGQIFNWDIAIEAKRYGRIILAGGLTCENIIEAVNKVQPYGIDVSSGVEGNTKGRKDHNKLKLFIENARKAV